MLERPPSDRIRSDRIRCAWAAFSKYGLVFKSCAYSFRLKAQLFDAVVSLVALYGCAGWTLSLNMEDQLRTIRHRLLRISCARRHLDEMWIDFIKRVKAEAEDRMMTSNYVCWVPAYRRQECGL